MRFFLPSSGSARCARHAIDIGSAIQRNGERRTAYVSSRKENSAEKNRSNTSFWYGAGLRRLSSTRAGDSAAAAFQ
ncbi:MAG: hypothetical protein BWY35_02428 [Firmicutes bacterium ADurb.Bin248]|nr:MAG: hypothetical protein BWY35_02428 [Firmicutes bacterium ADurb.Bin248]